MKEKNTKVTIIVSVGKTKMASSWKRKELMLLKQLIK